MLIAFCRLRRIRLNEADSEPISSRLVWTYSGVSSCPMLTLSAISEISATGRVTSTRSKTSTMTIVTIKVPAKRQHEPEECLIGAGQRHPERDRDDLRADNFTQFPAKSILRAIEGDHRRGGILGCAVAAEANLAADFQRMGERQKLPSRGVAYRHRFRLAGIVAKTVDDVGFPIRRPVVDISRVERRLAIIVFW